MRVTYRTPFMCGSRGGGPGPPNFEAQIFAAALTPLCDVSKILLGPPPLNKSWIRTCPSHISDSIQLEKPGHWHNGITFVFCTIRIGANSHLCSCMWGSDQLQCWPLRGQQVYYQRLISGNVHYIHLCKTSE